MNLKTLKETAPWNWPEGTDKELLAVFADSEKSDPDRIVAAELASDLTVINEPLVEGLLALVENPRESDSLRGQAAISLGPILELCEIDGFEDPTEVPIGQACFERTKARLERAYHDSLVPKEVKRRVLEASTRTFAAWHENAIRQAFLSGDPNWQLTSVFCMGYVAGFEREILESIKSDNPAVQYLAISAASVWQIADAWPHILQKLEDEETDKPTLLASIDAVASLRPREAQEVLASLLDADDSDISEAASEAIGMAEERLKTHATEDDDSGISGDGTLN